MKWTLVENLRRTEAVRKLKLFDFNWCYQSSKTREAENWGWAEGVKRERQAKRRVPTATGKRRRLPVCYVSSTQPPPSSLLCRQAYGGWQHDIASEEREEEGGPGASRWLDIQNVDSWRRRCRLTLTFLYLTPVEAWRNHHQLFTCSSSHCLPYLSSQKVSCFFQNKKPSFTN